MKLNLGCGRDKKVGYVNVDSSKQVNPDKVWDLEITPLPFEDNSIEEISAEHVLEHVNRFIPLVHDLWRISKNGAKINIKVPFYSSWGQYNNPTHVRFFTPFTFNYFCSEYNYSHQVGTEKPIFSMERVKINFGIGTSKKVNWLFNPLINLNHKVYCRFFSYIIPAAEIEYELKIIK